MLALVRTYEEAAGHLRSKGHEQKRMFLRITAYGASHQVRLYSVTNVGFRLFVLQTFIFLGCLVSFVLKILYLFLYAIFKVHVYFQLPVIRIPFRRNPAATCSPMPSPA